MLVTDNLAQVLCIKLNLLGAFQTLRHGWHEGTMGLSHSLLHPTQAVEDLSIKLKSY